MPAFAGMTESWPRRRHLTNLASFRVAGLRHAQRPLLGRVELDALDALETLRDLATGSLDFLRVIVCLADVGREPLHPLVEPPEIAAELAEFVLDDMYLLARFDILEHRTRGIE